MEGEAVLSRSRGSFVLIMLGHAITQFMKRPLNFIVCVILFALTSPCFATEATKPNIVYILADDIGYGDFGCYGATKVKTPNVDKLASQGLRFTDAHAMASVCTPSRYALLTGEYAFRKKGTGIASGIEGLLIEPGRTTVPSLLKRAGYTTGIVGKWHLGLGATPTDYNGEIKPGPLEIGFDYAWIIPATGDRTPCVWVENHRVVGRDPSDPIKLDYSVKRGEPRSLIHGIPRIGEQAGGKAALWDDERKERRPGAGRKLKTLRKRSRTGICRPSTVSSTTSTRI